MFDTWFYSQFAPDLAWQVTAQTVTCLTIQFNAIFVTLTEVQPCAWAGQRYQGPGMDLISLTGEHTAGLKQGQPQLWRCGSSPGAPGRSAPRPALLRGAAAPSAVPGSPLTHRDALTGGGTEPARLYQACSVNKVGVKFQLQQEMGKKQAQRHTGENPISADYFCDWRIYNFFLYKKELEAPYMLSADTTHLYSIKGKKTNHCHIPNPPAPPS